MLFFAVLFLASLTSAHRAEAQWNDFCARAAGVEAWTGTFSETRQGTTSFLNFQESVNELQTGEFRFQRHTGCIYLLVPEESDATFSVNNSFSQVLGETTIATEMHGSGDLPLNNATGGVFDFGGTGASLLVTLPAPNVIQTSTITANSETTTFPPATLPFALMRLDVDLGTFNPPAEGLEVVIRRQETSNGITRAVEWRLRPHVDEIVFWIRAFIPNSMPGTPGFIRPVPGRPGLAMIPGPIPGNDCFYTDHRGFNSAETASARVAAQFSLRLEDPPLLDGPHFQPSRTVEIDCGDGSVECDNPVDTSNSKVGPITRLSHGLEIKIDLRAKDSCFTGAPDARINGNIVVRMSRREIVFDGDVTKFPSFEGYFRVGDGSTKTLLLRSPPPGATTLSIGEIGKVHEEVAF